MAMNTQNGPNAPDSITDLWGDACELHAALDRHELDFFDGGRPAAEAPDSARRAAVDLAVALGRCRLHGVALPPEDDGVLPLEIAQAAAARLIDGLGEAGLIARGLGERFDEATDPIEIEDLCLELLSVRMDAWAAFLAIDEAYAAALEDEDKDEALPSRLMPLLDAIDRYDEALLDQLDVLSIVARTPALGNWRARLAPEFAESLPWFLDRTVIEREAAQIEREALAWEPPVPARMRTGTAVKVEPRAILIIIWSGLVDRYNNQIGQCAPAARPRRESTSVMTWRSPDGAMLARLDCTGLDRLLKEEDPAVELRFFAPPQGRDEPIDELVDRRKTVVLAGVSGEIVKDDRSHVLARFRVAEIFAPSTSPDLLVYGEEWEYVENPKDAIRMRWLVQAGGMHHERGRAELQRRMAPCRAVRRSSVVVVARPARQGGPLRGQRAGLGSGRDVETTALRPAATQGILLGGGCQGAERSSLLARRVPAAIAVVRTPA
jgi:hypothetical protein